MDKNKVNSDKMNDNDLNNDMANKDSFNNDLDSKGIEQVGEVIGMNGFQKIAGIMFSPIKTLKAIDSKSSFITPIILIILIGLFVGLATWESYEITYIQQLEDVYNQNGVEVSQGFMDGMVLFQRIVMYAAGLLSILGVLLSTLYYFVFGKIIGSETRYSKMLSVLLHVYVIRMLSSVFVGAFSLLGLNLDQNFASLAILFPTSMNTSAIYALASTLNVFSIWGMIVMVLGLRVVGKFSKRASLIAVAIAYIFSSAFVVLGVLMASMNGMM